MLEAQVSIRLQILGDRALWEALAEQPWSTQSITFQRGLDDCWNSEPHFAPHGYVSFENLAALKAALAEIPDHG
jgi:hypothetical protein